MAAPKIESFSEAQTRLALLYRALAHPARIAILEALAEHGACVCGEIVEVLPLAQSTVSQHLRELKAAGLVQGTISGKHTCYCLNPEGIRALSLLSRDFFAPLNRVHPASPPSKCSRPCSPGGDAHGDADLSVPCQ